MITVLYNFHCNLTTEKIAFHVNPTHYFLIFELQKHSLSKWKLFGIRMAVLVGMLLRMIINDAFECDDIRRKHMGQAYRAVFFEFMKPSPIDFLSTWNINS